MMGKHAITPSLLLMLFVLFGCVPAVTTGEPALQLTTGSEPMEQFTPTFTRTETSTSTILPTASQTPTLTSTITVEPSATQILILLPSATVRPARTRTTNRQNTPTATQTFTATLESTATETAPASATQCPISTPEPLWVEPVTSPTDQLSQTITVRIGNGEQVTIVTESGTFTATGDFNAYANPALVEVTLLPNTVHHLQVSAKVRTVSVNGCMYGGYSLSTTTDRQGAPLTIVQGMPIP